MIQRFEALSSGLGDLSQFGRIPEQKQRCLPPMTHYNQSDLPQECFTNYPYVQAVQNNFNSFRSSANVCLTSNSHPSFENNLSVNQHRQSFNIFERINSFPRYANRRNFEEPCSRSSTSHSNTYEEINVNIRRLTSDNRDNFQTLPKNNPFPHPASSHAFTSQCNNQFTPLKPQSLEQQVLLKKLTDLGSWLIKNNKLDSDRTMAPCILDSAMYEFGLNIKFTWLPNKRMMLLCSLGSSDVMIYNQPYSEKHSAEQIACHSTLEKLTKPCLNIVSQEGYLDMLTISNLPIDKSEQVNKNEFSILEKGETIHKAITSNEFLPDNSIELQNQLLLWTPQFSVSNLSIYLLTFQDIYQLKHLSQQSKHLGILEKLIILGKWLLEKHEFDLSKFSLSDLLNSAMCYFDLSLKYNYLPGNSKSFQKVMVFCSLGKTNVLICSSNFRQNENPKQLVCLKAIEKLTQPFLAISRVEGSIDQLIDSNFSIVGNYIGGNYNAINCILAAPKPPETPKSPEYSKSSANDNKSRKPGKNARRRLSKRMRIMKKLEMGKMNEIEVKKTKLENIEDKANKNEGNFKKKMDENLANIGEEKNKNNIEEQKSENLFNIGEKSKNKMCIVEQKSENLLNISEKIENKMEIVEQNNENNINIKEDQKSENLLNISEKIENKMNIVEQKSENLLNISEENGNKRNTEEQKSENLVLFGEKNDENKRNIEEQKSDNLMQVESKEIDNLNIDEKRNKDMEEKNNQDEHQQSEEMSIIKECLKIVDSLKETSTTSVHNNFSKFEDIKSIKKDCDDFLNNLANVLSKESALDEALPKDEHILNGNKALPSKGNPWTTKKVIIMNLNFTSKSSSAVQQYLSKFGHIEKAELYRTEMKRYVCLVTMRSEQEVEEICKKSKHQIGSYVCDIRKATPAEEKAGFFWQIQNEKKKRITDTVNQYNGNPWYAYGPSGPGLRYDPGYRYARTSFGYGPGLGYNQGFGYGNDLHYGQNFDNGDGQKKKKGKTKKKKNT